MRSDVIVIASIGSNDPAQMRLTQDDYMVHAFAPDRPDQPFSKAILPRRGWRGGLVPDAHSANSARDDGAIDSIPIPDEVARRLIPGEGLGYLTHNPFRRRMACNVDPDDVSTIQPHNDEAKEQIEANGRNNEQVHGGDIWGMIAQESAPSLAWRSMPLDHVLGDARLCDFKPEIEQFAVDARRAPQRVFDAHPPDQRTEVRLDLRSPSPRARLPTPITAKAGPMPTHERLRTDNREDLQDRREPSIQLDKEPAIVVCEPDRALHLTPQNDQLMSERCVLGFKPALRLEWRGPDGQYETQQRDHSALTLGDSFG